MVSVVHSGLKGHLISYATPWNESTWIKKDKSFSLVEENIYIRIKHSFIHLLKNNKHLRSDNNVLSSILSTTCMLSHFSCVRLFGTLWTVAHQAPLSMGFSRQEYWSGLPCLPPGYLPDVELNPCLWPPLHWQTGSLPLVPPGKLIYTYICIYSFLDSFSL